jgi:hypothetical protein
MRYYATKGLVIGILGIAYGLWIIWRGIRNDLWLYNYGDPVLPRWLFIAFGAITMIASAGYTAFLMHLI